MEDFDFENVFNEYYASRFEQGFPDLDSANTSGTNSIPVVNEQLNTEFTNLAIGNGNCSYEEDDSDDYPDDNDLISYKWVIKVTTSIAQGEDPMHFPQAVVQDYSFANLGHVHVFAVPNGDLVKCNVETINDPSGFDDKCITVGWYDFARNLGLNPGDKIHMTVLNPVDRVCVRVVRHTIV